MAEVADFVGLSEIVGFNALAAVVEFAGKNRKNGWAATIHLVVQHAIASLGQLPLLEALLSCGERYWEEVVFRRFRSQYPLGFGDQIAAGRRQVLFFASVRRQIVDFPRTGLLGFQPLADCLELPEANGDLTAVFGKHPDHRLTSGRGRAAVQHRPQAFAVRSRRGG